MNLFNFLSSGSKVAVVGNENLDGKPLITPFVDGQGNPKTDNNARPLGSIMLAQNKRTLNGTFINGSRRVAFLSGTLEELTNIVKQNNLKDGTEVPGTIVIKESLAKFHPNQNPKINPGSGEVIRFVIGENEYPVYMQQSYSPDEKALDSLIRSEDDAIAWLNAHQVNMMTDQQSAKVIPETAGVPATEQ